MPTLETELCQMLPGLLLVARPSGRFAKDNVQDKLNLT